MGWNAVAALFALLGTGMQAFGALRELSDRDPDFRSAVAVLELQDARPPLWRPLRRREHARVLGALLKESPAEAAAYRRVELALVGWSAMCVASTIALIGAIVEAAA